MPGTSVNRAGEPIYAGVPTFAKLPLALDADAREALRAVRRVAVELGFEGMEVVEVSPPDDHAEVTAYLANRLVLEALSGLALRRLGRDPQPELPCPRPVH
jgi:hypothetical protein